MDNLLKCYILVLLFCLHIEKPAYSSVYILLKLNWNFELNVQFEVSYDLCKCFTVKLNEFPRAVPLLFSPPPVKCFYHSLDWSRSLHNTKLWANVHKYSIYRLRLCEILVLDSNQGS
jgi:hypothetical protein